jgi:polar amino acid transport system substrate-binding protein
MTTVPSALDAVAKREVDVAVGPISITAERAERTRFTQPYFHSSLGILAPQTSGWFSRVSGFLSKAFVVGLSVLLFVLAIVGTLIWLAERKTNSEQFPSRPVPGIANGVWFAIVTMTTVGYGDRVPTTPAGRVIAGVWMVVALLTASSLTAGIATAITVAQLAPPAVASADQLAGRRVVTVRGTPGIAFAQRARARIVLVDRFEDGVALVAGGDAAALVFDRPMLRYHLRKNPELPLVVSEASYAPQGYGFAVADPEIQHELNVALLRASESGAVRRVVESWFGRTAADD